MFNILLLYMAGPAFENLGMMTAVAVVDRVKCLMHLMTVGTITYIHV